MIYVTTDRVQAMPLAGTFVVLRQGGTEIVYGRTA